VAGDIVDDKRSGGRELKVEALREFELRRGRAGRRLVDEMSLRETVVSARRKSEVEEGMLEEKRRRKRESDECVGAEEVAKRVG
jgi:hypothetical protein